ncbi:MAG: DUF4238 domain-containing protein, partial [Longimicrobiales bacterium]
ARTPARYIEDTTRWNRELGTWFDETLQNAIDDLKRAKDRAKLNTRPRRRPPGDFPVKVTIEKDPESGGGWVKAETVIGRRMWIASIRQRASSTWRELLKHRWAIIPAPDEMSWLTSDDPVIRLNYNSPTDYNFGGGYGSKGSEFLFPLSPRHLLYTRIGERLPTTMHVDMELARRLQAMIIMHAHRWVFGSVADPTVLEVRPRHIDAAAFANEARQWANWHAEQSAAESELD